MFKVLVLAFLYGFFYLDHPLAVYLSRSSVYRADFLLRAIFAVFPMVVLRLLGTSNFNYNIIHIH